MPKPREVTINIETRDDGNYVVIRDPKGVKLEYRAETQHVSLNLTIELKSGNVEDCSSLDWAMHDDY